MTKEDYNKSRPKIKCPNCGKLVTKANFNKHYVACINPQSKLNTKNKDKQCVNHSGLYCQYCSKLCKNKNSLAQHEIRCKDNLNRKDYNKLGVYSANIRKGKTKEQLPEIQKQVNTMLQKYSNGYVSPNTGRKIVVDYVHKEHNNNEIKKWLNYIFKTNVIIPKYEILKEHPEHYIPIKITEQIKYVTNKHILFEHQLIVSIYLGNVNVDSYTIHHIDRNRSNNVIDNLMVFKTLTDHKRFHNSKFAYLLYNEIEHTFTCEIRKVV